MMFFRGEREKDLLARSAGRMFGSPHSFRGGKREKRRAFLVRTREGRGRLIAVFYRSSTHDKSEPQTLLQQIPERFCTLHTFSRRQSEGNCTSGREDVSFELYSELPEANGSVGASATEVVSTSGFGDEASMNLRVYEEYNILSLSSLPPGFSGKNKHQEIADGIKGKSAVFDNPWDLISSEPTTGERDFYYRYGRGRGRNRSTSFLTSRRPRGYSIKPLSSLESCLIAQLYKEHVEMDDYVYTPPSSPTAPTLRPLFVTDVKEIICRASSDSYGVQFGSGENKVQKGGEAYAETESVLGVPSLPEIDSVELPKKLIQKRGKGCLGRSNSSNMSVTPKNFWSQGSPNGMLLFCIGITIGVISSIMANKREVYKLNGLLKQAENLVQDLQEELEMKDSLTVKELANEGYASQQNNDFSIRHQPLGPFFPKQRFTESNNCDSEELYDKKEDEKPESMSKIEAELEAELERLELNMCSTIVQTRLSNLLEIHPDFDGDIVQGEMRAYMTNRGDRGQYDSDQDVSHTSTTPTHTANYAVLSRELSLRLHEVIQARLEERTMELETALQKSRNWAPLVESGGVKSQRDFLNCEIGPSSSYGCSTMIEDSDYIARPRVLNLSEEALDVYNEAYEELMRITEPQREPAIHSN